MKTRHRRSRIDPPPSATPARLDPETPQGPRFLQVGQFAPRGRGFS